MEEYNDNEEEEILVAQPYDHYLEEVKEEQRKLAKEFKKKSGKHIPFISTKLNGIKKSTELNIQEQKDEFVRCAVNPIYFIETYLTIFDQTQGEAGEIVPFKLFEFQVRLIEEYQLNRFNVANKYRQAGISTCTCAYLAWYVMFHENRSVAIVANKLETAQNELMSDVVEFINSAPSWLRPTANRKDTEKLKRYSNNSELGAFSAAKGLRGMTPTLLFWDETAWTEKGDKFWEAAGPTMQTGGRAIFVSTPNGLDAVFYKYFEGARKKNKDGKKKKGNNFTAIELWWFNDPRYIRDGETKKMDLVWFKNKNKKDEIKLEDEDWSPEKRIQLMDEGWEATSSWFEEQILQANGDMRKVSQELLCSFLGSGDNFIAQEVLKDIEENTIIPPETEEYHDKNMHIFEEPQELASYLMTIDVATGHGDDFCALHILKIEEIIKERIIKKHGRKKKVKMRSHNTVQVAEYYGRITPQEIAEIGYTYGKKYNEAYAVVDITGGIGAETMKKLIELGYSLEDIHFTESTHKPTRDTFSGYIKHTTKRLPDGKLSKIDLLPGFRIGTNRGFVLTEMERSIRMREMDIKSVRLLSELKTFVTVNGSRVADHKRSFHDDLVMALAMGIYVMNFEMKKYDVSPEKTKKMIDAMFKMDANTVIKEVKGENKTEKKYFQQRPNPYGEHNWLMSGLNKRRN
jgi:hypothetical protein